MASRTLTVVDVSSQSYDRHIFIEISVSHIEIIKKTKYLHIIYSSNTIDPFCDLGQTPIDDTGLSSDVSD